MIKTSTPCHIQVPPRGSGAVGSCLGQHSLEFLRAMILANGTLCMEIAHSSRARSSLMALVANITTGLNLPELVGVLLKSTIAPSCCACMVLSLGQCKPDPERNCMLWCRSYGLLFYPSPSTPVIWISQWAFLRAMNGVALSRDQMLICGLRHGGGLGILEA